MNGTCLKLEKLEPNEFVIIKYVYEIKEEDIDKPIKNTVVKLTGKVGEEKKPVIPKGEKLPEVEIPEDKVKGEGSVRIIKTLTHYNQFLGDACFVFDVEAKLDGNIIYSDVIAMNFSEAGPRSYEIDHLPIGTEVTVTEVYSGHSYELEEGCQKSQTVKIDTINTEKEIEFTNTYNNKLIAGKSLVNHYTYSEEHRYLVNQESLAYQDKNQFEVRKLAGGYGDPFDWTYYEVEEDLIEGGKRISVINDLQPKYVRLKVFAPQKILDDLEIASGSEKWEYRADDGYIHYNEILPSGEETEPLIIKVNIPEGYTQDFNVIIVVEASRVLYSDGVPYEDWDLIMDDN